MRVYNADADVKPVKLPPGSQIVWVDGHWSICLPHGYEVFVPSLDEAITDGVAISEEDFQALEEAFAEDQKQPELHAKYVEQQAQKKLAPKTRFKRWVAQKFGVY